MGYSYSIYRKSNRLFGRKELIGEISLSNSTWSTDTWYVYKYVGSRKTEIAKIVCYASNTYCMDNERYQHYDSIFSYEVSVRTSGFWSNYKKINANELSTSNYIGNGWISGCWDSNDSYECIDSGKEDEKDDVVFSMGFDLIRKS